MNVKVLDILLNSTEDCNAMYLAKFNKVFNENSVVNVLFSCLFTFLQNICQFVTHTGRF